MHTRRIVTGHDAQGQSVFISDGPAPRTTAFQAVPGFETSLLWATDSAAPLPTPHTDPTPQVTSWVPGPGGTRLMFITFPPDAVMMQPGFDPAAAGQEYLQVLPGLAECFEPEHPGKHTTPTVDYGVLLEGELHLELDNGATRRLAPRDVVIQNGTRHAWRNTSDRPATMLFVLVGAPQPKA